MAQGIVKASAQNMEILPKWCSQKCGASNGITAMESNMQAKGITQ